MHCLGCTMPWCRLNEIYLGSTPIMVIAFSALKHLKKSYIGTV